MSDTHTLADFFIKRLEAMPQDRRADEIRAAIAQGHGSLVSPDDATTSARPATHLFEIDLFDAHATGDSFDAAAAHWLTVARRVCTPQVAA